MKKLSYILLCGLMFILSACEKDTESTNFAPVVTTGTASNIYRMGATLSGSITLTETNTAQSYGILFSELESMAEYDEYPVKDGSTSYSVLIQNLEPGETYYYCAYASSGYSIAKSQIKSFTTTQSNAPVFNEVILQSKDEKSCAVSVELLDEGGSELLMTGFVWGEAGSGDPTIKSNVVNVEPQGSRLSATIKGLEPNKTYLVRAYGVNAQGVGYSNSISVTTNTATVPFLSNIEVTDSTEVSITVQASVIDAGLGEVTKFGFCYSSESKEPTTAHLVAENIEGDSKNFIALIENLNPETTYYFRAYAENEKGVGYSDVLAYTLTKKKEFGAVDLGLSVLWANFNLGATSSDGYGDYYAFGEISPKTTYTEANWIKPGTLYLPAEKDAATQQLGEDWRMPTKEEVSELLTECTWELITSGKQYVYKVTGKTGNFIILPLTGSWNEDPAERFDNYEARYRTSEAYLESTDESVDDPSTIVLELQKNFADTEVDSSAGWKGHPIRPVKGERKQEESGSDVTEKSITLTEAGTLANFMKEAEQRSIQKLTISGPINGDDIRLIREMAGRDVNGYETEGQLTDLDISEATIVEGGGYYYRYLDDYGNYYNYFTTNYEVGIRMFHKTILKNIRIPKNTIIIDTAAFRECSSLINIVIPENVTSIGANAFTKCSSLTDIIIPNTVTYLGASIFYECSLLSEITIPDGVTYLGSYAFHGCSSLINIKLSEGLTSIGDHTFYSCDALSNIVIPDAVTTIGDYAFYGCGSLTDVVVGEGVVSIGNTAFGECKQLSTIAIPQGLISIGNGAFCNCFELKEFKIPSGITTIEDISFYGCKSLTEMIIPDGVTSIGSGAFQYCSSLAQVAVPNSVASIGTNAFSGCAFTSFSIPENITVIAAGTFDGCKSLVDITIPNSVTEIGQSAFYACDALSDITIPNSVTEIGAKAFYSSGLKELKIPNSVTTIGMEAFCGCTSLVSVTLSDSLKVLGQSAFQKCRSLSEVISNATTPPTLGQAAFSQILATATLYIPSRAFSSYMESGWTNCFSNIKSEEGFFYYNFNDGDNHLVNWGGGTITVENGELKITNPTLEEPYSFQLCAELSNNAFVKDSSYKLSMKISGSVPGRISAHLQIVDGYQVAGLFPDIDFDTIGQTLELTTVCDADGATRLIFNLGAYVGNIYIDDLSLIPIISDN